MKQKITLMLFICGAISVASFAQTDKMTPEDKQEKNEAREARIAKKNDVAIFHKQMLALKEYANEKKKIPALQKANSKAIVKVLAVIDSNDNDDEDNKTLIGYIRQDVGDNSTNMYEVIYDKATKKIVSVKRTPEAGDADKEAADDNDDAVKPGTKKATPKKSKDDDDDPDDKPSKTKKDKDDD